MHDQLRAECWRVINLKEKSKYKWQEAVSRWIIEKSHKRSIDDDKRILRWLHTHLYDVYMHEIRAQTVADIIFAKQTEGASNATVNRVLAVLRAILNKAAKEWEWIDSAPFVRTLPERNSRIRWPKQDEAVRLLSELPLHLKAMAKFSLLTGLRESNVVNLTWSQVDIQRKCAWIHADQAKGKKAIPVPLNDQAIEIIRAQVGKHDRNVFSYRGKPVTGCNNHAWAKALKRAGIEDFRWHDLRHTWASWHVQNGTPLHILQELGSWSSYEMVKRYAHLSPAHLSAYSNNAEIGANLVQEELRLDSNNA